MRVEIRDSFVKDVKKTSLENKQKIKQILESIKTADTVTELRNIKKISGHKIFYRIRLGDYRLGFAIENDTLILLHFMHRKEIYRFFP